jgi:hypothetical protein
MGNYYIQDVGLGMVPFENRKLYPSLHEKDASHTKLCITYGDAIIAGPVYIYRNDERDNVISEKFITNIEKAIIEEVESEGVLTQEMLKTKLSKMIVDRFNADKTPQQEKNAILSAVNDGKYFEGIMSQLKNTQKFLKEEE